MPGVPKLRHLADELREKHAAGLSIRALAREYDTSRASIESALAYYAEGSLTREEERERQRDDLGRLLPSFPWGNRPVRGRPLSNQEALDVVLPRGRR